MPKRTSPRKSKKRIRRRIECSRCGKSYSYSGSRSHSCGDDAPESDETAFDLFDSLNDTLDTEPPEELDVSSDVGSDYCGDVDAGFDAEPMLPSDLRKRLRDRLRKRFTEEDLAHFDDDDSGDSECNQDTSGDSVSENWESCQEDSEPGEDFDQNQRQEQETANNGSWLHALPQKTGVLLYWLLLFLFSWQCGFSVSDSAVEMLLKFLSRFLWIVGTFDENSAMAKVARCMPNTLYKLKKHLGLMNNDDFVKYVVCPKCKTLYDYKDCIQSRCGRQVSARCRFVPWSRHPQRNKRGKSTSIVY